MNLVKISKYTINTDNLCAVYEENGFIKIVMNGSEIMYRTQTLSLEDTLKLLEPKEPKQRKPKFRVEEKDE